MKQAKGTQWTYLFIIHDLQTTFNQGNIVESGIKHHDPNPLANGDV
jgi:hypothetical protein